MTHQVTNTIKLWHFYNKGRWTIKNAKTFFHWL